ncbi:MAG: hypothetical protein ACI85O_002780 [Saprospiraceae bacterium]|jgi:hypothetical protein
MKESEFEQIPYLRQLKKWGILPPNPHLGGLFSLLNFL